MSSALTLAGFVLLLAALVGLVKGGVRHLGLVGRKQSAWALVAAVAAMAVGGATAPEAPPSTPIHRASSDVPKLIEHSPEVVRSAAARPVSSPRAAASSRPTSSSRFGPLLIAASGGDGDSWHDTHGGEYRLGLVNTPEASECGGAAATAYRKRKLRGGFYARGYTTDTYGRRVSVVYTPDGANLNVLMAREGIANDKYLSQFRDENPQLARELDAAFAQAKARRAGVWGSCSSSRPATPSRPQPLVGSGCHPDYQTCVPVKGDGSGAGSANDLDCGDVGKVVYLRQVGRDPYRLDANGDGVGCESYA